MDKTVRLWHISRKECLCVFQVPLILLLFLLFILVLLLLTLPPPSTLTV